MKQKSALLHVLVCLALLAGLVFAPFTGAVSAQDLPETPNYAPISEMAPRWSFEVLASVSSPSAAFSPSANRFLVVWAGNNDETSERRVFGQLLDPVTGQEVGSNDFLIAQLLNASGNYMADPVAVWNQAREMFLVVYTARNVNAYSGTPQIFYTWVDASGALQSYPTRLSSTNGTRPAAACEDNGGCAAAWHDANGNVFARRIGSDGLLQGAAFYLHDATAPAAAGVSARVVWNPVTDEYLAGWRLSDGKIMSQRLLPGGTLYGSPLTINASGGKEMSLAVNLSTGTTLLTWDDGSAVYSQLLTAANQPAQPEGVTQLYDGTLNTARPVSMYSPGQDHFLTVWWAETGAGGDIYGRHLTGAGLPVEGQGVIRLSQHTDPAGLTDAQAFPPANLACTPAGLNTCLVVWPARDEDLSAGRLEVFAQFLAPNHAPVFNPIADRSINELALLSFAVSAVDSDLPPQSLTYSLVDFPEGMTIDPITGQIRWRPTEAQGPHVYAVTVRATDSGYPALSAAASFNITVNEVNQNPVLQAIPDQTIREGDLLDLSASASDADLPPQKLTYSLVDFPAGMTIDPTTGQILWQTDESHGPNTFNVTVRVEDDFTPPGWAMLRFTIVVNDENQAPVLDPIGDKLVDEGTALTFTVTASDADLPPQTLTFNVTGLPQGATFNTATGAFAWTPSEDQGPGSYPLTFTVSDNYSPTAGTASEAITITVNEVNQAPVIDPIAGQSVREGENLLFAVTGSDADLPANTLTFSLVNPPAGASITPGGAFSWTPGYDQSGSYTITVRLSDNGVPPLYAERTFDVTVIEENLLPVITPIADVNVNEGATVSFTVAATDPDGTPQPLGFALASGAPSGANIHASTGLFTWQTSESDGPGVYEITVLVSDGVALVQASFTVTVNEVNQAPVLAPIGNKTVNEGEQLTIIINASDSDLPAQNLSFGVFPLEPGASFDHITRTYTWTPSETQGPGVYTVTFMVLDNYIPDPKTASETITITVNEVNQTRSSPKSAILTPKPASTSTSSKARSSPPRSLPTTTTCPPRPSPMPWCRSRLP
jgi:hypothetical protein